MTKIKTYRLIKEYSSYSKKRGEYRKRTIIHKNIATYDDAVSIIMKEYPDAIIKNNVATNIGGFLYPAKIEIK